MGKPKFPRKKYDTPLHPWKEDRIKSERELIKKYGLKNNREVWKAKTFLKKYREQARELLAKVGGGDPQIKKESDQLLLHLTKMGILPSGSSLDDVLALDTESILSRRLQTLVYHRGFSNTVNQARQLVSHGHIAIGNRKTTIPGYVVTEEEENKIGYTANSPLNAASHPARPKTDVYKTIVSTYKKEETAEIDKGKKIEKPAKPKKQEEKSAKEKKEGKTKSKKEPKDAAEEESKELEEPTPAEKQLEVKDDKIKETNKKEEGNE